MNIRRALICGAALVMFSASGVFAQTIHQRKENQQARIAQGTKSGQLTPHETTKLERQQRSINHEERNMRKADNGHLTKADRRTLNHRQNRASRNIYDKKHNGRRGY